LFRRNLNDAIHDEMSRAFDGNVKPISEYAALAKDVWQVWSELREGIKPKVKVASIN
jgi:hypothetical protein